jgi:hypothetical protein
MNYNNIINNMTASFNGCVKTKAGKPKYKNIGILILALIICVLAYTNSSLRDKVSMHQYYQGQLVHTYSDQIQVIKELEFKVRMCTCTASSESDN